MEKEQQGNGKKRRRGKGEGERAVEDVSRRGEECGSYTQLARTLLKSGRCSSRIARSHRAGERVERRSDETK